MPWRCNSLMMRPSVQWVLGFGLLAVAVAFGAGLVVSAAGAGVVAGAEVVVVAAGVVETAEGRGVAVPLTCGAAVVVAVVCCATGSSAEASVKLRGPAAWADAEARSMAATRMILRMWCLPD